MILAWSLAAAPPVWYMAFWLIMLWRDRRNGR